MESSVQIEIKSTPKDWEIARLGDVCNQRNKIIQPSGKGEHKFVGLEHINPGETRVHKYQLDTDIKSSKFRFYKGDILYGKLRPYLDKAAIADFEGICSTDLLVLTTINNTAVADFLIYLIHSNQFIQNSISSTSGTNHPRTSWKEISKFKFGLPPLPEQRRIAEVLGTVDSAIQKVGGAIESTERLKKGLMQRLLTKGIRHERFKESEVGRVPEEWEVVRLGDALELCQYGLSVKMDETGKYPIIKMDDFVNGVVVPDKVKYIDLDEKTFKNFKLEKGDILFNRTNSYELVGRTGIFLLRSDYVFASYLIRLRPKKEKVDSQFLTFYMAFSNDRIRQQLATRAVHQANINATNLQNYNIPLPPLPEQRRIAEILSAFDRKLALSRRRKEKLERVKKGLMNELLTGRKRVKVENDGNIY